MLHKWNFTFAINHMHMLTEKLKARYEFFQYLLIQPDVQTEHDAYEPAWRGSKKHKFWSDLIWYGDLIHPFIKFTDCS